MKQPAALALGFFDGLHLGHQRVLQTAADSGLPVTVCTFPYSDAPGNHDTPRLILPEERLSLFTRYGVSEAAEWGFSEIRDLTPVAYVERLTEAFQPAVIVCGFNYRFGAGASGDTRTLDALCRERSIALRVCDPVQVLGEPVSSTRIRKLLEEGRPEEAAECLGRFFSFTLPVVPGQQLGRRLNFPTVNQIFPEILIRPRFGVYLSRVTVEGKLYRGVTNLGVRPTVGSEHVLAETNLFGCSEDLYGKELRVELLSFLRPETRFPSLEALKEQIAADVRQAEAMEMPELSAL